MGLVGVGNFLVIFIFCYLRDFLGSTVLDFNMFLLNILQRELDIGEVFECA